MKLIQTNRDNKILIEFAAETEEEHKVLNNLRDHFFFGFPEDGTYPEYAGKKSDEKNVLSIFLEYKPF